MMVKADALIASPFVGGTQILVLCMTRETRGSFFEIERNLKVLVYEKKQPFEIL